jgi:serine phosphatase RsbU (regulator of sigma subunit)
MSKNARLTYLLTLVVLIGEAVLLSIDVGLFYAGEAKSYLFGYGILFLKDAIACVVFGAIYMLIRRQIEAASLPDAAFWVEPEQAFKSGAILIAIIIATLAVYSGLFNPSEFLAEEGAEQTSPSPQSIYTVFKTHLSALTMGGYLLAMFIVAERLILFRREKSTKSNFILMAVFLALGSAAMIGAKKGEQFNVLSIAFLSVAALMIVVNLLRLSWILPIPRDEKIRAIFLVPLIIGGIAVAFQGLNFESHLSAYSTVVSIFLKGAATFGVLYLSFTFFSLLFYLPTSEAFERKSSEVRNLYAMSKFITDVFDEEKIYDSLVSYAREACGGSSSVWFNMFHEFSEETRPAENGIAAKLPNGVWGGEDGYFTTVAQQNITLESIQHFSEKAKFIGRDIVSKKEVVRIDDIENDTRFGASPSTVKNLLRRVKSSQTARENGICSAVSVPLVARNKLIGALNVAKDVEYGFVKDDIELITTFADQAAIAIDNSRLIRELIDKERLQQELLVAQKIQLRLLPQTQPKMAGFDLDGVSYPAYEVGGDYYDYVQINGEETKVGLMIADVSGKGTSAAFYMAELKGIVQSLARIYPNAPSEFLSRANETITRGLGKASFISALYGILDTEKKTLRLSNAGHCPAITIQGDATKILKMKGMALGLDKGNIFAKNVEEETIELNVNDVVVLYTDGVIEAVNRFDEQFGYERIVEAAKRARYKSASEIKNDIFNAVNAFTDGGGAVRDDLTIVVLKRYA